MKSSNRLRYSIINSSVASMAQILTIVSKFIVQTIFIHELGIKYLGVNGLFSNILLLLSFSELGISSAIVFAMYEPLAKNNKLMIIGLMNFFRHAYNIIAIIVAFSGLVLVPFLDFFIKDGQGIPNLRIYFLLFLANSVISYLFTYKRSILTADQKEYINVINQFIFIVVQSILQIVLLILFHNYVAFLVVQLLCTFISNLVISIKVNRLYPYLLSNKSQKIDSDKLSSILKNTAGLIGSQFGGIVVFGTDNILISSFLGISLVGLYANYTMITTSVSNILNKAVGAVTSSIGNLTVSKDNDYVYDVFKKYNFLNFTLTFFISACLIGIINNFIIVWLGHRYLLSQMTVTIIVMNFAINQLRQSPMNFIAAYGLYRKIGWKSLFEAVINLLFSLYFLSVLNLGIAGTLLGTIVTNLILNSWWEPRLVFKFGIHKKMTLYFKNYLFYLLLLVVNSLCINFVVDKISISGILGLILSLMVSLLITLCLFLISFFKNNEFRFFLNLFRNLFNRYRKIKR